MLEVYEFSTLRNHFGVKGGVTTIWNEIGEISEKRQFWKDYLSDLVIQLDRRETPSSKTLN